MDAPLLGQCVVLGGLSSRPELNGQRGVAGSFEGGRYAVALDGGGASVRVRPGNLSPAAAEPVSGSVVRSDVVAAVEQGEEEAVLAWIESGGRVDTTYERGGVSGLTLLMGAAIGGHERLVELLLQHGAEINRQDSDGITALMHAASRGQERVVELLIRRGAEVNLQSSDGFTVLMYAAFFNHPAVVRRLLRAGADAAARGASGKTALQVAKEKGHTECVKVFAETVAEGRAEAGGVSSGAAAAAEDALLLGQRVVLGGLAARPELNGRRGVAQSFEGGRYAVAIEGGGESVRVRPSNLSPAVAAPSGGVAISDEVIAAVERGDEEAVLAWLEVGGRVNATYEKGEMSGLTLLLCAAVHGHERVVELLLQHGAEINLQSSDGATALMLAAGQGHERVVDLLIRRGVELNLQNSDGGTTLMAAASQGHERVVELLIRRGAELNLQNSKGGTALMYAASLNHTAVVRRLLRAGADVAARAENNMTALQAAKEKGHAECVRVIEEHAAPAAAAEKAAREAAWAAGAEAREAERAAAEATAARHAEALLAEEEAEKEERARESKKGKKKKKKGKGGGGGAGPSREPDESALAAGEEAELAAALDQSARLEDEARRSAEEQAPPAESAGDSPPSEEQPATALSLADAKFDTGRAAVPESTLGGETTCIVCFTRPKTHVAGPCGHQCVCGPCSDRLQLCPYCREPVVMWIATRIV